MTVSVTEAAAKHIKRQLNLRGGGLGIRVGIRTAGCSGMAYVLEFVDEADVLDHRYQDNGVCVFVDPKSLVYLDGTEIDFVREGLNEGLEFKNPNAASECGCGESFNVDA